MHVALQGWRWMSIVNDVVALLCSVLFDSTTVVVTCRIQYSGTPHKGHLSNQDTKYVLLASWHEDTSLIRTHFIGSRVSVLERYYISITIVQSDTGKYHEFGAYSIITSA